jgi:hypothetical protein
VVDVAGTNCFETGTGAGRRAVVATVVAVFVFKVEGLSTGDDLALTSEGVA